MQNYKMPINKKGNKMVKSVNLSLFSIPDSTKYEKQQKSKEEYYLQISPRFETHTLTFTNKIQKLKCVQHEDLDTEESVKSNESSKTDRSMKLSQKHHIEQPKSQFYNEIKSSRRLKTEQ
ncbi:unnamed protein product (macronuclear) [Paramecium tetraurelia]|uniref:Uncharacterized protein n=1 Tax=Paramecium tetraurelia TaxID=5888 RepID=A0BB92_PARTE|nr:uncharacterized protein GSPATT00000244001 [Paramecium tetraurelia]CAK55809.1 unnamed protein product [Paramecium tetraurelia]|eukprot:XP_001423207.1 hypothetical protein (macronuclear) [Paramecium tetraurelia strain d4-2]